MPPKKILIATTNPGKVNELRQLLNDSVNCVCLSDFQNIQDVVEDGKTFAQNARKKALDYAEQTGLLTLADDSGLEIDALAGLPGINTARFSGEKSDDRSLLDHKNMQKVLTMLKSVEWEKRTAKFVCAMCVANPGKVLTEVKGELSGIITTEEQGTNGFGYDPIFFVPKLNKTAAQLSKQEKNTISHRGKAIAELLPILRQLK
jgi:XTP/dITP diphosphohydrolase